MSNRTGWVAPFVGLVFVAAYVAVAILLGEGQDATRKSADELVKYYGGHDTEQTIGALLIGVAAITLLFWAEQLRRCCGMPRAQRASSRPWRSRARSSSWA